MATVPIEVCDTTIPAAFRAMVAASPDHVAVRTYTHELSYARLDAWSDAIAGQLLDRVGVVHQPVPFLLPQGPLAIATTLAILKTGSFYVPLDSSWGSKRTVDVVRALNASVILTHAELAPSLPRLDAAVIVPSPEPALAVPAVHVEISPDQPAYVYFTSGSTGRPKGVIDCHRNVLHNVMRYTRALHITPGDRLSLVQSCGFSGAVSSMFAALLNGATSCPVDIRLETPARLARWLDDLSVTIYHSVPSLFRSVVSAGDLFRHVRLVRLEGDRATRLDLDLFRRHFAAPSKLAVGLGTTETGLVCQWFFDHRSTVPDNVVPIGYPVTDMQFEVRSNVGGLAPRGASGEIVVRSRFLALGYWNDPEATARVFEQVAGSAERTYRTGDLGRIAADGSLEYLGRMDGRVRVRGQWIDLADIDAALAALAGIQEAVVVAHSRATADPWLVAYYVSEMATTPSGSELRRELARSLPAHMLPAQFVRCERLPLNANGKIDHGALAPPTSARPHTADSIVEPVNLVQRRMCELWEELLGVSPVGIHDDFFDLGGDSLLAVLMLDRIESVFGCSLDASRLLGPGEATVERLAWLAVTGSPELETPVVTIRNGNHRPAFFFLHGDYFSGGIYCRELARHLNSEQPFFALPPCGFDGKPIPASYEAMARRHVEVIHAIQPHGPYLLGGECNGGLVAYEIARLLESRGERVLLLLLLSASAQNVRLASLPTWLLRAGGAIGMASETQRYVLRRFSDFLRNQQEAHTLAALIDLLRKLPRLATELLAFARERNSEVPSSLQPGPFRLEGYRDEVRTIYQRIDREYVPGAFGGRVTLIRGREETPDMTTERTWWQRVAADVETFEVPGDMVTKLTRHVKPLAQTMDRLLERALST